MCILRSLPSSTRNRCVSGVPLPPPGVPALMVQSIATVLLVMANGGRRRAAVQGDGPMTPSNAHDAVPAPQSFYEPLGALFSRYPKLFGTLLSISILLGLLPAVADSVQLEGLQPWREGGCLEAYSSWP